MPARVHRKRHLNFGEVFFTLACHECHRFDHWGVLWLSLQVYCSQSLEDRLAAH